MSRVDLTTEEKRWLKQMAGGGAQMLPPAVAARLLELGLAEQKLGGTGISQKGKELLMKGNT